MSCYSPHATTLDIADLLSDDDRRSVDGPAPGSSAAGHSGGEVDALHVQQKFISTAGSGANPQGIETSVTFRYGQQQLPPWEPASGDADQTETDTGIGSAVLIALQAKVEAGAHTARAPKKSGRKKTKPATGIDGDVDSAAGSKLVHRLLAVAQKPKKLPSDKTAIDKAQIDDELVDFASLIGITITKEHLDGALFGPCNASEAKVISLRERLSQVRHGLWADADNTKEGYLRYIATFLTWLHISHPECFRRTVHGACVPMVSVPYFLQFLEHLSQRRMDAVVSQKTLRSIQARLHPARLQLAPRGLALRGLTRISGQTGSGLRDQLVHAIFAPIMPHTSPLKHLDLGPILHLPHPLGTSLDQDKVWQIFTCPAQILVSGNSKKEKVAMELNSLPFMVDRPDYFKLAGNGQDGDLKHRAEAAACSYLASLIQHKFLETTLETFTLTPNAGTRSAKSLHEFCQLCSIQLLLWADPSHDCLQGLSAKSTAGWVLMYLQLRSMGHLKTIPAETLASDPHCRKVLSNAMSAASCTDLADTFNHSNETGDGAADNVTAAAVALVTKVRNTRATLVDQIMAATAVADQLEEENGIRQLIAGLDADSHELLSDGGMPEMDEEVIQKADTCTKMMWCLTIHDLEDIRGRLIACDFLGDHGLYATDGIGLTGLIDTPTGALTIGAKDYFAGVANGLTYLRSSIWLPLYTEEELANLDRSVAVPIRDNAQWKATKKIINERMNEFMKETGQLSSKAETADSLPNLSEIEFMFLRGFHVGSLELQDTHPTHPDVVPPVGSNGKDINKVLNKNAQMMNSTFHQTAAIMSLLPRGDDACALKLGALAPHCNSATAPYNLKGLQIRIQHGKTNDFQKLDIRPLTHAKIMHQCPLLHMAIFLWSRLNPPHGAPLQYADIVSGAWAMFQLLDTSSPTGPFRRNSAKLATLATRLQQWHSHGYGKDDIKKTLHLMRRLMTQTLHQCGVNTEVLGRLGGWSLQNSLNSAYAIGVHPGVAVAAAGFHGMKAYNPVQAVAIPPDAVVKLMFGTVMQVHDPDTGTTQDLDIDEAIEASERFFCSPAGKGKQSATPMLKALRVLATALAQYLPVIRLLWPGHWIFHRHPLFSKDISHPDRQLWDRWADFQTEVVTSASVWYADQERGGAQPDTLDPYRPNRGMLTRAAGLDAHWSIDDKAVRMVSNPCLYYCLNQPRSSREEDGEEAVTLAKEITTETLVKQCDQLAKNFQVFAEDHPMVEPAILGMMTRVSKSRLELIEMTETTPDKVTPCTMVFDPRVVQHQQERAVKQQAIATSEVLRLLVATQSRVNALATQLEAATRGTSVEGHHPRSRVGPAAVPPNTGEAGKSLLDGQQVRALAQFGKVICGLKGSDAVKLVLFGCEMPSGRISVPPLGLQSSRTSLSIASDRYHAACTVVADELRAHFYDESAISRVQSKLSSDPVMELASAVSAVDASGGTENDKKTFRPARLMVWTWFVDVTIFRILCQENIHLHGTRHQSAVDIEKMSATPEGQMIAADRFACQFADSPQSSGGSFFGFGRYCNALATTSANNPHCIPCAKNLVDEGATTILVPVARYHANHTPLGPRPEVATPAPREPVSTAPVPPHSPLVASATSDFQTHGVGFSCAPPAANHGTGAADLKCTAPAPVAATVCDTACATQQGSGAGELPLSAHASLADDTVRAEEDANLQNAKLESLFATKQIAAMSKADLCYLAARCLGWLYDSVDLDEWLLHRLPAVPDGAPRHQTARYTPVGLGNSSQSKCKGLVWLQSAHPDLSKEVLSSAALLAAKPCLKSSCGEGQKPPSAFLSVVKCGAFHNSAGLKPFMKVIKEAFVDVAILHVVRSRNDSPPVGFGMRMHQTDDPSSEVAWSWDKVLEACPDEFAPLTFRASCGLWAWLTSGTDANSTPTSWYSLMRFQVLGTAQGPVKVCTPLLNHVSVMVTSTHRHRPQAEAAHEGELCKPAIRKRVANALPGDMPRTQLPKRARRNTASVHRRPAEATAFQHPPASQLVVPCSVVGPACGSSPPVTPAVYHEQLSDLNITSGQLSGVWQQRYNRLVHPGHDISAITVGKYDLCKVDFQTCAPGAWLNDKIINTMAALLQNHNMVCLQSGISAPRRWLFNSHFLTQLFFVGGFSFERVKTWRRERRLKGCDGDGVHPLFELYGRLRLLDQVVVPVNYDNAHWALFVMDFHWHTQENPKITYFDSICTGRIDIAKQAAEALIQWTANEWEREQQELVPDAITPLPDRLQAENWDMDLTPGAPQQSNDYDCGVFTMLAMKSVCANKDYGCFTYNQSQVTDIQRAVCTLECAAGVLHS